MAGRAATLGYRYGDPEGPMPPPPLPAILSNEAVQAEDVTGKGPVAMRSRDLLAAEAGPRDLWEGLEERTEAAVSQGTAVVGLDKATLESAPEGCATLGSDEVEIMARVRAGSPSAGSH